MIKDKFHKNLHLILLGFIIIGLVPYVVYWGTQKAGFHLDEMFTFMQIQGGGLRNPFRRMALFDQWYETSALVNHLTVAGGDAFSFTSSITANGVHPPIFFMLAHAAYSFFPDTFSIWPAVALNLVFYTGSLIVLYFLSRLIIKDKYLSLIPVLLWGVSAAAISLVVFIRPYNILMFFCLLFAYFLCKFVIEEKKTRYLIAILIAAAGGVLTHYFFFAFAFILSAYAGLYLLIKREWLSLVKFVLTMLMPVVLYTVVSGRTPIDVLGQSHGAGAIERLFGPIGDYAGRIERYTGQFERLFGDISVFVVISIVIVFSLLALFNRGGSGVKFRSLLERKDVGIYLILGFSSLTFFLLIARISPWIEYRYMSGIAPFLVLLFTVPLVYGVKTLGVRRIFVFVFIAVPCFLLLTVNAFPRYLYRENVEVGISLSQHRDVPVVYIGRSAVVASTFMHFLEFEDQILFLRMRDGQMPELELLDEKNYESGLVLVFSSYPEPTYENIEKVLTATGLNNYVFYGFTDRLAFYFLS